MRFALGVALAVLLGVGLVAAQMQIPRASGESWGRSFGLTMLVMGFSLAFTAFVVLALWLMGAQF